MPTAQMRGRAPPLRNGAQFNTGVELMEKTFCTEIEQLRGNRDYLDDRGIISMVRRRIECDGSSASTEQLVELIDTHPKELAFSLLLCTLRFPVHSRILMDKIFQAIEDYSKEQMDYCILKFQGDKDKEKNADTVIGEAMTLLFSFFDDYTANAQSGNLEAIYLVRRRYPRSILYVDAHEFTPLHGVCCALNMDIFQYFINWHLQENPEGRGGLYNMNDSGITPMDTLIYTQHDIVPQLKWLRSHALLTSKDVEKWLLVHRSAHSSSRETIQFFINLYPSGVMSEDDDGNLPIALHLGKRYRARNSFSDEDYAITKLLITEGIKNGGIDTIGGLFHQEPDEEMCCTLDALLNEVGEENHARLWDMIDEWIEEATGGDYTLAPIVNHLNMTHMSDSLFEFVLNRYGVLNSNANEDGIPPLAQAWQRQMRIRGALLNGGQFNTAVVFNNSEKILGDKPTNHYNSSIARHRPAYNSCSKNDFKGKNEIVALVLKDMPNGTTFFIYDSAINEYTRITDQVKIVKQIKSRLGRSSKNLR